MRIVQLIKVFCFSGGSLDIIQAGYAFSIALLIASLSETRYIDVNISLSKYPIWIYCFIVSPKSLKIIMRN